MMLLVIKASSGALRIVRTRGSSVEGSEPLAVEGRLGGAWVVASTQGWLPKELIKQHNSNYSKNA